MASSDDEAWTKAAELCARLGGEFEVLMVFPLPNGKAICLKAIKHPWDVGHLRTLSQQLQEIPGVERVVIDIPAKP